MRWLIAIAAAFLLGGLGAAWLPTSSLPRAILALVALGIAAWCAASGALRRRNAVGMALSLAAAAAGWAAAAAPSAGSDVPPGTARMTGVVERVEHGRHGPRAVLRVAEGHRLADGAVLPPGTRLSLDGLLPPGARIRVLARLHPRVVFRNPTPHPPWPARSRIDGYGRISGPATIVSRNRLASDFEAARRRVRTALHETLSPRAAGIASALVLGESNAVDEGDLQRVRDAGLSHVLAVSGLHVTLVAGLFVLIARRALAAFPPLANRFEVGRLAAAAGIVMAFAFAAFAGAAPSALRAAATASIAWALIAAGRRPRLTSVAAFAALVLGALAPQDIARPGFVLSIAATAGVLGAHRPRDRTAHQWLAAAASVSFRATVATAPIVLYCFGDVPRVSVLANVFLVPLAAGALIPLAMVHAALAVLVPDLAFTTGALFELVADAFLSACATFAELDPLGAPPPLDRLQLLAVSGGCAAVLLLRRPTHRMVAVAVACALVAGAEVRLLDRQRPTDALRVTFLDVGQGDAALVDLPDGRAIVIDAGGAMSGPDPGERAVVPLLRARRRHDIAALILSHPHPDHFGGARAIVSAASVEQLWDTEQGQVELPEGPLSQLVELARAGGSDVVHPQRLCDRDVRFGAAHIETLWPCPGYDPGHDPNDNSFVLRIALGRRAVLFTGDIESHAESALVTSDLQLTADVLKVPHHGSRTSSSDAFLERVRPRVAVVSAGRGNRFGHPHPEVIQRYQRRAIGLFRTDRDGGVVVWTDGDRMTVHTLDGDAVEVP